MADMEWDPDLYLREIRNEIARFDEFEDAVAAATAGRPVLSALELGVGTGVTTRRIRPLHPDATWTGIDASPAMLERARAEFPDADLRVARLEDPLPAGSFDLVVSALAVHHLPGQGKRHLFGRIAAVLAEGAAFVLGDVVVPERAEDVQIEIDWVVDLPDSVDDQVEWLREAGFVPEVTWSYRDLAVIRAVRTP